MFALVFLQEISRKFGLAAAGARWMSDKKIVRWRAVGDAHHVCG